MMRSQLWQNLKITLPTMLVFGVLGYAASLPLSYIFAYDAARLKLLTLPPLPISASPEQLVDLG